MLREGAFWRDRQAGEDHRRRRGRARRIDGIGGRIRCIYTNLAVVDVTPQGLFVIEMIPDMTVEKLQTLTEPKPQLASHWQALGAARGPRGPCRVKNPAISPERA
jgi:acyl CoA:acetate/3-ketoacid CoA transferase beta subunit